MWVTGDYYWMLNFCPMHLVRKNDKGVGKYMLDYNSAFTVYQFNSVRYNGNYIFNWLN